MKVIFAPFLILTLNCSKIPAVATLTIENETTYTLLAEYQMSEKDGKKAGSFETTAGESENHDWTYKQHQSGDKKKEEKLSFFLKADFFKIKMRSLRLHEGQKEIQLQWSDSGSGSHELKIPDHELQGLKPAEVTELINKADDRILLYDFGEPEQSLYIAPSALDSELQFGLTSEQGTEFQPLEKVDSIPIGEVVGKDIIQKTYVCTIVGCKQKENL